MSEIFDSQILLTALPALSRRALIAANPVVAEQNTKNAEGDINDGTINYKELREQHRQAKIESLKNLPTSNFNWTLKQENLDTNYRELRVEEWKTKLILLQKKSFLEAHPTKTFSVHELKNLLPAEWELRRVANRFSEITKITVDAGSPEFNIARDLFRGTIKSLERIENPYLWLMYQLKSVECRQLFNSTEKRLFHGTNIANIEPISRNNFNYRLAGTAVGTVHGKGVYFSPDSSTSMQYSKNGNCMILARAQQGQICAGNNSTILPLPNHDTSGNGNILVKYYDNQFYPEYIVHY